MTPKLLREAGEALYGPRWQSDLARDLGVGDRSVRYWLAGTYAIPPGIWEDLRILIHTREILLAHVAVPVSAACVSARTGRTSH